MAARVQVGSTTTQATGPPAENPLHALEEDGALRAQAFAKTEGTARAQARVACLSSPCAPRIATDFVYDELRATCSRASSRLRNLKIAYSQEAVRDHLECEAFAQLDRELNAYVLDADAGGASTPFPSAVMPSSPRHAPAPH